MGRTGGGDPDVEGLMANAVGFAAHRQRREGKNTRHWGRRPVDGGVARDVNRGDPPPPHRGISLNQLFSTEPLRREALVRPNTGSLGPSVDADDAADEDGMTAIQRLIDSQYDSCVSKTGSRGGGSKARDDGGELHGSFLDGRLSWCSSLPPRPLQRAKGRASEEACVRLGDLEAAKTSQVTARRESCSVGVQCDTRAAATAVELQQLEQLRQQTLAGDPESVAHFLARRIRALELDRFGHSAAFTSALLQKTLL
ncbi:uncharacterized protein Tco025E_07818 [Trypanosoma conorhini]|uniref:Uncharacterized protein n=1 Tax=Trypanosoma conorhini TaxID=83891 RepID=A0A422NI87_9TRYP|nr:uncharacterized protein Tco025E_07818 [Trypanosoma conorhini]RNF05198.1 hypothetical protein Tco025E_07818 [Trypanosoma conorhini]